MLRRRRSVRSFAMTLFVATISGAMAPLTAGDAGAQTMARDSASATGPFAVGTTTLEITGVAWLESWNKNLATDRLIGGRLVIGQDWVPGWQSVVELELQRAHLGKSRDAFLAGLSGLVRRRLFSWGRSETFVELGVGASLATRPVPIRGTAVNFLLHGGGGVVRPLTTRTSLVVGARVWHLSNGGVIYNKQHNPDIEGIGGYAGLQVHFR